MSDDDRPLAGRVALVTGGSRNLGRATVVSLARRGADVVIASHHGGAAADEVVAECRALGVRAIAVQFDLADPVAVQVAAETARTQLGSVDMYVACAAIRPRQAFLDTTIEDWNRVLGTNLSSAFYLAKALTPDMIARRWGRIIHISGADGWTGLTNRPHNVTAKLGLHGLTKALALELAEYGVTVNTVAPGAFDTVRDPKNYPGWDPVAKARSIPVGRLGRPDELAAACVYLASEAAAFITGQVIHLNGGQFLL